MMALMTGMRRGELLALRWADVNFEQGTVFVHRTIALLAPYGYVESEPKTKAGRRRVVLPDVAVEALKRHQVQQKLRQTAAGDQWKDKGIVFCNRHGDFLALTTLREQFDRLLTQAGLPHMRFHDLRHSAATILLVAGIHPKVVQERLGHSKISMTPDTYSHVLPSMQREAAKKMDSLFKKP